MNEQPLGDARIQITYVEGSTALLTVRGKDHALTPDELRKLARAAEAVADAIDQNDPEFWDSY